MTTLQTLKASIASLAAAQTVSKMHGDCVRFNSIPMQVVASNPSTETLWVRTEYLPGYFAAHDRQWRDDSVIGAFMRFDPMI